MAGVSGDMGAKTGSAEVDGQKKSNGWFTAYRDDLAAAAVVPAGGHGGDAAGPVVAHPHRAAEEAGRPPGCLSEVPSRVPSRLIDRIRSHGPYSSR